MSVTMTEKAFQLDEEIQRELDVYYENVITENDLAVDNFSLPNNNVFEDKEDTWLRWCDEQGNIIPTGEERVRIEAERADHEAAARRDAEERAAQLAAKLRELGVDPDQL